MHTVKGCGPNPFNLLTLSNRTSENSNLNLKYCVALFNVIRKSYTKNEENTFFHYLFIIFFCNSNLILKFCAVLSIVIEKCYARNEEHLSMNFRFVQVFPTKDPETCGTHTSHQV